MTTLRQAQQPHFDKLSDRSEHSLKLGKQIKARIIAILFIISSHKRAAGCTIYDNIENTKKIILNEIQKNF